MKFKIASAAVSIFLENCVVAFSWLLIWIAAFICLWLTGYNSYETTGLFWLGTLVLYLICLGKFVVPTHADILCRAEQSSQLKHRPLQSFKDIKVTDGHEELWQLEKLRQKTFLSQLKYTKPDLNLAKQDPYALRIAFILILACAFFVSPASTSLKIKSGLFLPDHEESASIDPGFAQIKIIPPVYSGMKTLVLTQASDHQIEIIPGSTINVEAQTSWGRPVLKMGSAQFPLKQKEDFWIFETQIPETDSIKITTFGIPRFNQSVKWLKDNPPIIGWNGKIEILPTGEMRLPLKIAEDFGIQKLTLRAILTPGETIPVFGAPLSIEKRMNLVIRSSSEIKPVFDTTGHVWAGKNVSIIVEAEDFAGNVSETAPLDIVLPIRDFHNPVSIQLSQIRSDLLNLRGVVSDIVENVQAVLYRPDLYGWDNVMTLGLRSIDSRLHYSQDKDDLESVASMLWSLAMRMEDGQVSETQKSLQQALEKLQEALQKGADKSEVNELMQQMQQALIQHLRTLAQRIQQNQPAEKISNLQKTMNLNALGDFLQKLQQDMQKGDVNAAMQKLNQLQQLADMLGSSAAQGIPKDMQEMMQDISDLQNLIARQKKMLDQTRKNNPEDANKLLAEQRDIESQAKALADKLSIKPPAIDEALNELGKSSESLEAKDLASSAEHQQKALDLLNQSSQSMQKRLQQRMQNMMGLSLGSADNPGQVDPLGRPQRNLRDDGTEIPGGTTRKKADQIIKTLREREADMKRPLEERNYYQRLLKQW